RLKTGKEETLMTFSQEARDALLSVIRGDLSRFEQTKDPLFARTAYHNCGGDPQLLNYLRDYFEITNIDLRRLDFSAVEDKSCLSLTRMYGFSNDDCYAERATHDMVIMFLKSPLVDIPDSHKKTFEKLFGKLIEASGGGVERDALYHTDEGFSKEWFNTIKSLGYVDSMFEYEDLWDSNPFPKYTFLDFLCEGHCLLYSWEWLKRMADLLWGSHRDHDMARLSEFLNALIAEYVFKDLFGWELSNPTFEDFLSFLGASDG
ncbi:MAG: hypothetical protein AAGM67_05425, partial [Bacteroidota bacterium]